MLTQNKEKGQQKSFPVQGIVFQVLDKVRRASLTSTKQVWLSSYEFCLVEEHQRVTTWLEDPNCLVGGVMRVQDELEELLSWLRRNELSTFLMFIIEVSCLKFVKKALIIMASRRFTSNLHLIVTTDPSPSRALIRRSRESSPICIEELTSLFTPTKKTPYFLLIVRGSTTLMLCKDDVLCFFFEANHCTTFAVLFHPLTFEMSFLEVC